MKIEIKDKHSQECIRKVAKNCGREVQAMVTAKLTDLYTSCVIDTAFRATLWHKGTARPPQNGSRVYVIFSGKYNYTTFEHADGIADYYVDEGFIIDGYEDVENAVVEAWANLPDYDKGLALIGEGNGELKKS